MKRLEEVTQLFIKDNELQKSKLKSIDLLAKLCGKIQNYSHDYFDLYVENNHPQKKLKLENTTVGVRGASRTYNEIQGYKMAREFVEQKVASKELLTLDDAIKLHTYVRGWQHEKEPQVFAEKRIIIEDEEQGLLYTSADPKDYPVCWDYILNQINNNPYNLHPVALSSLVFYLLLHVHSLNDGNGRTSRMINSYVLKKYGYDLIHPAYEQNFVWDRINYTRALESTGDFYAPINEGIIKIHEWNTYFINKIYQAYMELFKAKISSKVGLMKEKLLKKDYKRPNLILPVTEAVEFKLEPGYEKVYGKVTGKWEYKNQQGETIFWRLRFERIMNGEMRKIYITFCYYDDGKWYTDQVSVPSPYNFYGSEFIKTGETNILLCEGEKAAEAIRKLAAEKNLLSIAWYLGTVGLTQMDWPQLAGCNVYIWRDNDEFGQMMEKTICEILAKLNCNIKILSEDALKDKAEKWDAGNAIAEGMNSAGFAEFMNNFIEYKPEDLALKKVV